MINFPEISFNRDCLKCNIRAIVLSYTKKGTMTVLCPKCGKKFSMVRPNCPYCGVAFIEPEEISLPSKHDASVGSLEKKPTSLWKQGLKFGMTLTVLNAISLIVTERSPAQLAGYLSYLPILFFVYTLIGIIFIFLWRRVRSIL